MGWFTSLMVLVGLIYSLIGTLGVIYFCYLMFDHGFKWTWEHMIARPWRVHRLTMKIEKARKRRVNAVRKSSRNKR